MKLHISRTIVASATILMLASDLSLAQDAGGTAPPESKPESAQQTPLPPLEVTTSSSKKAKKASAKASAAKAAQVQAEATPPAPPPTTSDGGSTAAGRGQRLCGEGRHGRHQDQHAAAGSPAVDLDRHAPADRGSQAAEPRRFARLCAGRAHQPVRLRSALRQLLHSRLRCHQYGPLSRWAASAQQRLRPVQDGDVRPRQRDGAARAVRRLFMARAMPAASSTCTPSGRRRRRSAKSNT